MEKRLSWVWMLPILFVSIALVTGRFVEDTIWYDEVTTMLFIGGGKFNPISPVDVLYRVALDNAWPPGYFLIAHFWDYLISGSLLGHRLIGLWGGVLSIAAMYRLGKSVFESERAGLISALLLATCAGLLHQFHEARGYTLWLFLSIVQIWVYWLALKPRIFARHKSVRWGFALATAGVLYLHYVSVVSIFILGLYHLIFERKNRNYIRLLKLGINGCLLYSPWIAVLAIGYYNKTLTETGQLLGTYWSSLFAFSNGMPLLLFAIGAYSVWRWRRHPVLKMLLFWIIGVYTLVAIGNYFANFVHHPRHILVVLIPIVLLVTNAIESLWQRIPLLSFFVLLMWVCMGALNAGDLDFVEDMTGQYAIIPADAMDLTIDVALTCIPEDDKVVFGIWPRHIDTWIHNMTMYYHFNNAGFSFTLLDRFEPITLLAPVKLENIPYTERVTNFIEGATNVWLFVVTDANYQHEQEMFEDTMADMGYVERDVIVATANLTGYLYHTVDASVEDLHSCAAAQID